MPYIEEIVKAGKTIEITKSFSARYGKKGAGRKSNCSETTEAMKKVNERNAEKKLRRLINANFGYKDIHLVLTYRRGERPTPEQARKDLEQFLRRLRRYFKKHGRELKYIAVTEYANAAIHHHLVISSMDTRDLTDLWTHGQPRPTYLDRSGQYAQLASYLIKETGKTFKTPQSAVRKRWCASRNLVKPVVKKRVVAADSWQKEPRAWKGYYIDKSSIAEGVHELTGYRYLYYMMIKI